MRRRKRHRSKLQSVAQQQPTPHPAGGEKEDSSTAPERTHTQMQGQPVRRSAAQIPRPATSGDGLSVGEAYEAKRQHPKCSQGIPEQALKIP